MYITLNANIVSFIDYGAIIPQKHLSIGVNCMKIILKWNIYKLISPVLDGILVNSIRSSTLFVITFASFHCGVTITSLSNIDYDVMTK